MANLTLIPVNEPDTLRKKIDGYHFDRIGGGGDVSEELAKANGLTEYDEGGPNHMTLHIVPGVLCAVKPRSAALRALTTSGYLYRAHGNDAPDIAIAGDWQNLFDDGWSE